MKFVLTMQCDSAAFTSDTGGDPRPEIARVLSEAAGKMIRLNPPLKRGDGFVLRDINGNRIGVAEVKA